MERVIPALLLLFAAQSPAELAFDNARAAHTAGRLTDAESGYRDYLKRFGPRAEVLANLGALQARKDDYQNAINSYQQALKLDPSLAPLHLNLGLAYFKQSQQAAALGEFDQFLKRDPANRQAQQLRAMSLLELERYGDAEEQYRALLPGDLSVALGLSMALLKQQKIAEARAVLDPLLSGGDSAELQLTLGEALLGDGQLEEALAAFERARAINPDLPRLRLNIGGIYWRQRKTGEALKLWREEYARDPRGFDAIYTLGAALALDEKEQAQAEQHLRRALALRPRNARVNYQLAKLLWRKSKSPEAAVLLAAATQADMEFREAFILYGTVLQSQGKTAAAAKVFARAKELSQKELASQRDLFVESK